MNLDDFMEHAALIAATKRLQDRLQDENERLRAALKATMPYVDGFMRLQDQRIDPPKDTYDKAAAVAFQARAALAQVEQ